MPQAAASWELRQYREASRREGARDADADAPPPAHLLLCCVRRRDHGTSMYCMRCAVAALLTWRCAAPETPQPSESSESEADEVLAAVLLGDVPSLA